MQLQDIFAVAYWVVALGASGLYAWHAVTIFTQSRQPDELPRPKPWIWHQRWLNFVGALAGWLALWILVKAFGACLYSACGVEFGAIHAVGALIAFVGITGYLPSTVVSLVAGVGGLAGKLTELVASWVAKK